MNNFNSNYETINLIEQIGKFEIEIVMNKKLFELQVIPEELYKIVMDKLLFKIEGLKEQLELIVN